MIKRFCDICSTEITEILEVTVVNIWVDVTPPVVQECHNTKKEIGLELCNGCAFLSGVRGKDQSEMVDGVLEKISILLAKNVNAVKDERIGAGK